MNRAKLRSALFSAWHKAKKDGVNSAVNELLQNQWLTTAQLRVVQQRKLHCILSYSGQNVPYYRSLFRNIEISGRSEFLESDFLRIPPLTKHLILQEKKALVSEDLAGNKLHSNSTSGSTGEALRFYTDSRSKAFRQAAEFRSDSYTGWRMGERIVRLWGAPIDQRRASAFRGKLHGIVTGQRFLSSFDLSTEKMDKFVTTISEFKPTLLVAYPGPLEEFATHCLERAVTFPSLRAIVSSAETLWPHQRNLTESTFGVNVFNRYGAREIGQVGGECEAHDGLHISVDRHVVEVVDETGQPCLPGQQGRILVTDLDNFGMPLIRYDIGDSGVLAADRTCSCGRGLPLLDKVDGRTLEIVRTPDGRRIGGTFWTLLLRSRVALRQFQVVQENANGVTINFVKDPGFDEAVLKYFTAQIQERCGTNFNVHFVEKDLIELTGSGKRRLIVSRVPNPGDNLRSPKP